MSFSAPWLIGRRRKLIAIAIDFSIIILIYHANYINQFGSYPNLIVSYSLSTFWVIISYIIGRYMRISELNFSTFLNNIFKILILFFLCNIIYLLINWGYSIGIFLIKDIYLFSQAEKELSNFFIQSSLKFSIISLTAQYFLSLIAYNIYDNQKDWIFFGSESKFEELF